MLSGIVLEVGTLVHPADLRGKPELGVCVCACAHFPHWPPLSLRTEDCVCLLAGHAAITKPSFSAPLLNTYCVLGPGLVTGMQTNRRWPVTDATRAQSDL